MILLFYGWPKKIEETFPFYQKVIEKYNPSIYAHFWHNETNTGELIRSDRNDEINVYNISKFVKQYNPKQLLITQPYKHYVKYPTPDHTYAVPHYLSQFLSIQRVLNLANEEDGCIIKARTDVTYDGELPELDTIGNNDFFTSGYYDTNQKLTHQVSDRICDIFNIMGPNASKGISLLYEKAKQLAYSQTIFDPENLLAHCCKDFNIKLLNGKANIIRN